MKLCGIKYRWKKNNNKKYQFKTIGLKKENLLTVHEFYVGFSPGKTFSKQHSSETFKINLLPFVSNMALLCHVSV